MTLIRWTQGMRRHIKNEFQVVYQAVLFSYFKKRTANTLIRVKCQFSLSLLEKAPTGGDIYYKQQTGGFFFLSQP